MQRSARLALFVFAAVEVAALVLFRVHGSDQWFFYDEWDFLVDRDADDVDDLLRPHNEHWSTLPVIGYRVIWQVFGLRTYLPYQLVLIVLHLVAAALLRAVMRRAGVRPWFATAAASLFALFGAGSENIVWAFQIGFTGSLVLGLTHLLLADHDGPFDMRDWLGLVAGLGALMCSGVGVAMVVVVGLAMLFRRGVKLALLHTGPLAAVFALWWFAFGHDEYRAADPSISDIARFVRTGSGATFDALGELPGVGVALGALLVAGLTLAWRHIDRPDVRRRAAAPAALLIGAVVFLGISGAGRASGYDPSFARQSRYLHLVAAFCVPAVAVAADAIARRWRLLAPALLALLVIGIPGNIAAIDDRDPRALGRRDLILTLPRLPAASEAPRALRPAADLLAPQITMGWLLDGVAVGRVPPPPDNVPTHVKAGARLRLSLYHANEAVTTSVCETLRDPADRTLQAGEVLVVRSGVLVISDGRRETAVTYIPTAGHTVRALRGPLDVTVAPASGAVVLCS